MNIEFDGLRVSYRVTGEGRPIVLLHSYLEAGGVWQPMSDRFSEEGSRVLSRKHGWQIMTGWSPGNLTVKE